MSEEQKKLLEKQLWAIANLLRGKMDADDYRNYILGFIFFKYLSEKLHLYANKILAPDNLTYEQLDENSENGKIYVEAVKKACVKELGYFLKPYFTYVPSLQSKQKRLHLQIYSRPSCTYLKVDQRQI